MDDADIYFYILIFLISAALAAIQHYLKNLIGKRLHMAHLGDNLEYALICGRNKSAFRLRTRRIGPYFEFRKFMKKRKPSRIQMIMKEDVCGIEMLRKAAFAFDNKKIPCSVQRNKLNNSRKIVVECGRNLELAYACAFTVFTEAFEIPPYDEILQRKIGWFPPEGLGFGHFNEISRYGVSIDLDDLQSVVEDLKNSRDKDAFVLFGWRSRELPKLVKELSEEGNVRFVLEFPVFNQREKDVIGKLEEKGALLNKVDQTLPSHLIKNPMDSERVEKIRDRALSRDVLAYYIPLGTDAYSVTERLKQILIDSGACSDKIFSTGKTVKYRLSEFVTSDWKPQDEAYIKRPWLVKIDDELRAKFEKTDDHPFGL